MKLINAAVKFIALLAVALSAGLLIVIFFAGNPQVSAFFLRILMLAAIAFMGGFSGRLFFHKLPAAGLVLITLAANLSAILIMDHFYNSPYQFAFVNSLSRPAIPAVGEISQIFFLLLVALPPLLLFKKRVRKNQPKNSIPFPDIKGFWRRTAQRFQYAINAIHPVRWKIWKRFKVWKKQPLAPASTPKSVQMKKPVASKQSAVRISKPRAAKSAQPVSKSSKPVLHAGQRATMKLTRRLFGRPPKDVRLVGEEVHVCPYCLEEVSKNDNHGVKICHECGTWHHQDCWDLTGACGVAHRNEL